MVDIVSDEELDEIGDDEYTGDNAETTAAAATTATKLQGDGDNKTTATQLVDDGASRETSAKTETTDPVSGENSAAPERTFGKEAEKSTEDVPSGGTGTSEKSGSDEGKAGEPGEKGAGGEGLDSKRLVHTFHTSYFYCLSEYICRGCFLTLGAFLLFLFVLLLTWMRFDHWGCVLSAASIR